MKVRTPSAMFIVAGMTMGMLVACGSVGSPIPPESVGVNATIERQKKLELLEEKQREAAAAAESTEPPQPDPMLTGAGCQSPSAPTGGNPVMFKLTLAGPVWPDTVILHHRWNVEACLLPWNIYDRDTKETGDKNRYKAIAAHLVGLSASKPSTRSRIPIRRRRQCQSPRGSRSEHTNERIGHLSRRAV